MTPYRRTIRWLLFAPPRVVRDAAAAGHSIEEHAEKVARILDRQAPAAPVGRAGAA